MAALVGSVQGVIGMEYLEHNVQSKWVGLQLHRAAKLVSDQAGVWKPLPCIYTKMLYALVTGIENPTAHFSQSQL